MRPCGTCSSHPESATTTGQGGLQGWGSPSWGVGQSPCVIARSAHSRAWLPVQSPLNPQHRMGTGGPQCPPHSHRGPSAPASQHSALGCGHGRVWDTGGAQGRTLCWELCPCAHSLALPVNGFPLAQHSQWEAVCLLRLV